MIALVVLVATACTSTNESGGATSASSTSSIATSTSTASSSPPTSSTTATTAPPPTTTATTAAPPTTAGPTTTGSPDSTDTASTTGAEADTGSDDLLLGDAGIGPAMFGDDGDGVVEELTALLGPPERDTGWVDPLEIGPCPGTELRLVSWGVLTLELTDDSPIVTGPRHFAAYSYGLEGQLGGEPAGLSTESGISLGSSVADLRAAHPDVVLNPEDDVVAAGFFVDEDLNGYVTGLDDDDVVTVIFGGRGCVQ